jgi:alkaline phosphatase D
VIDRRRFLKVLAAAGAPAVRGARAELDPPVNPKPRFAADPFSLGVASGSVEAAPEWAHLVHAEPKGLAPDRPYWYRFTAGAAQTPVGRTRTAPAAAVVPARLRFAFASCQP